MAKSRFEYVRNFELADSLVPGCCIVVRVDGHKFTRFTKTHSFDKPNDSRGLQLMNECAKAVMLEWSDIVMAYGQSDEYSFLLPAWSDLYNRRASKLSSSFASLFASSYVFLWPKFFGDAPLQSAPAFDGRAIAYPTPAHVRDYFAWRQADCHINNLYNTAFWSIVKSGLSTQAREFACERPLLQESEKALAGTSAAEKNELLFKRFGINYNNEPEMYRKGTVICRQGELALTRPNARNKKARARAEADARGDGTALATHHVDIIGEAFWAQRPALLRPDGRSLTTPQQQCSALDASSSSLSALDDGDKVTGRQCSTAAAIAAGAGAAPLGTSTGDVPALTDGESDASERALLEATLAASKVDMQLSRSDAVAVYSGAAASNGAS